MRSYADCLRQARMEAIMSGGIATVDGKEFTGKGGYWYLDGEKVTDIEAFLEKIPVDEFYVRSLMNL